MNSDGSQIQEEPPVIGVVDLKVGDDGTKSAAANTSVQRLQESDAVEKLVNLSATDSNKDKKEFSKTNRKKKKAIKLTEEDHYFSDHSVEPFDEHYYEKERRFFKEVKKSSKKKMKSREILNKKSSKDQLKF